MSAHQTVMLQVRIDDIPMAEALKRAGQFLEHPGFHQVVTLGPEFLLEATAHKQFRDILNKSDLALPEGMGLKVGGWLIGRPVRHRVPGVEFVLELMALAARTQRSVFLYGGSTHAAERASQALVRAYPGLRIAGFESGHRGVWQRLYDRRVIEKIHRARPDIVLVALGAPKQELWIERHRQGLHQVRIAIGVGRTFEYLAGHIPRAPRLMRRFGFEWLHTWLFAKQYHQPALRRQRVKNATWNFLTHVVRHGKT